MKLSAPVFHLKRRAKLMAREKNMPLHEALDHVARGEGFVRWSLLCEQLEARTPSQRILSRLCEADMLLLAARPGQGKTSLGIRLLLDAAREGRRAVFFTLEFSEQQANRRIHALNTHASETASAVETVTSDEICADLIIRHLAGSPVGTIAVIDYLQILDQQRNKPPLSEQIAALSEFARRNGIIFGFISQIGRSFDCESGLTPTLDDIRLPNVIDLKLFTKACFLHNGAIELQNIM